MKKIITMLIATLTLSTIITDTSAHERTRRNRKSTASSTTTPSKSAQRTRRGRMQTKPAPQPEAIKKAQENTQKVKSDTKALQAQLNAVEKATTTQQKEEAKKMVADTAQELLKDLQERSLLSDILTGYSSQQIQNARVKLKLLFSAQTQLKKQIHTKEEELAKVTDKGWIWNAALKGKEKQYETLTSEKNVLHNKLKRIERAIRNQKVIAGEEWSNAFRAILFSGALVGTDYFALGGAGAKLVGSYASPAASTALSSLKESKEYLKIAWDHGWSAATTLFSLYRLYSNATTIYTTAQAAYDTLMNDPSATEQARTEAKKKMDDAKNKHNSAKDKYESFKNNLQHNKAQKD